MTFDDFEVWVDGESWQVLHLVPDVPATEGGVLVMLQGERATALNQPYRKGIEVALAAGWHVVSYDMPFHGDAIRDGMGERLAGIGEAMVAGVDALALDTRVGRAVVAACLEMGLASPGRIGISGVSRGGYCGAQLMAAEPAVGALAAVAPVTDWQVMSDMNGVPREVLAAKALHAHVAALGRRPVWAVIGAHDDRVSTGLCQEWVELVRAEHQRLGAAGAVEFHLEPDAVGHTVPEERYADAAQFVVSVLNSR